MITVMFARKKGGSYRARHTIPVGKYADSSIMLDCFAVGGSFTFHNIAEAMRKEEHVDV